jgi:septal ring-binding cell division protein DamX
MKSLSAGQEKSSAVINKLPTMYEPTEGEISPNSVFFAPGLTQNIGDRSTQSKKWTETQTDLRKPLVSSAKTQKKVHFGARVQNRYIDENGAYHDVLSDYYDAYYHDHDIRLNQILAKNDGQSSTAVAVDTALIPNDKSPPLNLREIVKSLALELGKGLLVAGAVATGILLANLLPNKNKK